MRFSDRICDHFENPRHLGELPDPDLAVRIGNPVCGDTLVLQVRLTAGVISAVAWQGYGCSTALATGSLLAEHLLGKAVADLAAMDAGVVAELLGDLEPDQRHCLDLGAEVLAGLRAAAAGRAV